MGSDQGGRAERLGGSLPAGPGLLPPGKPPTPRWPDSLLQLWWEGRGQGPWRVMDRGAVHLCRLRDCPPVSAASCVLHEVILEEAAGYPPWAQTRGHRTSQTPQALEALEEGNPSARSRAHSRVCMCVHMLGCEAQVCSTPMQEQVCTPWHRPGEAGVQKQPASFLSLDPTQSCAETPLAAWQKLDLSAGVPSRVREGVKATQSAAALPGRAAG